MTGKNLLIPQIKISKQDARRFMLAHQSLFPPKQGSGKSGILQFIDQIGSIQFDPINVVGRNPDLVLQSRVHDYRPRLLDELLYEERRLVDGWDKMASIYLMSDWPQFRYRRYYLRQNPDPRKPPEKTLNEIMMRISRRGPLSSLDFKNSEKIDWHWGPTKAARASMEYLYSRGYLGIHHRINNRRYFDLIKKLVPKEILNTPEPFETMEDYQNWHVLRRIGSLGIAQVNSGESWAGIIGMNANKRNEICRRLTQQNKITPIEIDGLPGKPAFIRSCDLKIFSEIQKATPTNIEPAFIAPLDNLLWQRTFIEQIFNFKYRWEVYKPKTKREYGYYVLPVLYGDRFIARFDPTYDKKRKCLCLNNWWWEPNIELNDDMKEAIFTGLLTFYRYLMAEQFSISHTFQHDPQTNWLADFHKYR
jgi:uncharacterized protein YcaQ